MRPDKTPPPRVADSKPADGALQAMDHVANWVRYADTKATILTAGFGVVLTAVLNKADTIATATSEGKAGVVVWALLAVTVAAAIWTLLWLMRALAPSAKSNNHGVNRFAWPTLTNVDASTLIARGEAEDVREDAWRQVSNLSTIAARKFGAFTKAGVGFGLYVILAVALITTAVVAAP